MYLNSIKFIIIIKKILETHFHFTLKFIILNDLTKLNPRRIKLLIEFILLFSKSNSTSWLKLTNELSSIFRNLLFFRLRKRRLLLGKTILHILLRFYCHSSKVFPDLLSLQKFYYSFFRFDLMLNLIQSIELNSETFHLLFLLTCFCSVLMY